MSDNLIQLGGGSVAQREPNAAYIEQLEKELERAKAGEVIGGAFASVYYDNTCNYTLAGHICYYTVIGALEAAKFELLTDSREEDLFGPQ